MKRSQTILFFTRDTIPHASDEELSDEFNLEILTNISRLLKNSFPTKKIYATFGNHDYHPADQFPSNTDQLYSDTLKLWRDWIDADQDGVFLKGSPSFSTRSFLPFFFVISCNTLFTIYSSYTHYVYTLRE